MNQLLAQEGDLAEALDLLLRDWRKLAPRIRTLEHDVKVDNCRLNLRLHYPSLRDAKPAVGDLVDAISVYMPNFCLPRKEIDELHAKKDQLDAFAFHSEVTRLNRRACDLFRRVQLAKGRNGEAGELLLYVLTEWILEAPQIIAKMALKTSRDVPVHGADGVHARYDRTSKRLILYSGEAKIHASLGGAIRSAMTSISDAMSHAKLKHELELVKRHIDFSGLQTDAREALIAYLDPYGGGERANERVDIVTCLIGFDFDGYDRLDPESDDPDLTFCELARTELERAGRAFAQALVNAGLSKQAVELFLFPLPSVSEMRDLFQAEIGWRPDSCRN